MRGQGKGNIGESKTCKSKDMKLLSKTKGKFLINLGRRKELPHSSSRKRLCHSYYKQLIEH